ncbi:synaptic vesicle glycoprotein 2A-like isoform X2 [Contarinia nasturtii]|uniref:synaptic vesicle glycoprotein 2A-like isoform X2 n=1 Tax=Contarinia nasturtii TaxID=265458 RepID=UPI0012D47982|nr:synaptic vesicle glycoprotein 2A-like isoform X2 [Contarinia nasturtii]
MCHANSFTEVENGRRDSNNQPNMVDDLRTRKRIYDMDEALSKTKFGLFNYIVICVTGLILFVSFLETCSISYILPVLCDMDLTASQKGALTAAPFVGIICSSHLWGFAADTKGRRRVILPSLLTAFILSIICSFVQNYYIFTFLRFLNGFFVSSSAGIYAYLGEFHNSIQRSRAIMVSAVIYSTLCITMPITAWSVINQDWQFEIPIIDLTYKPWRLLVVVCGIPGFLSALALFFLPESPKYVLSQGNKMAAYQILQKMNRWNNGKNAQLELFEIREEVESTETKSNNIDGISHLSFLQTIWNQTSALFKPPYLKSTILVCTIQFGIFSISHGFSLFFAEIVNKMSANLDNFYDQRIMMCDNINTKPMNSTAQTEICVEKLDLSTIETGLSIEIIFAVGSVLAGLLINKIGKFSIIFVILMLSGFAGIGAMLTDIPALQVPLFVWLFSCCIAINVVASATFDLYPTSLRAMAMSIALMFGRLGAVTGTNAAAILLENHCETTFYLSGSILLVMAALSFFIPNIHKKINESAEQNPVKSNHRPSVLSFSGSFRGV